MWLEIYAITVTWALVGGLLMIACQDIKARSTWGAIILALVMGGPIFLVIQSLMCLNRWCREREM